MLKHKRFSMNNADAPLSVESLPSLESPGSLDELPPDFTSLLRSIRRHLHKRPEVGFQEYETHRFIRQTLESQGLKVQGPVAETGLYVDIEGAKPGPRVGYRADIDALPTRDAKTVSYASQHAGTAHLCGHDAHTAIGIGVALLINRFRDQLAGSVRVFFQPNEEGSPSGAVALIEEGVLDKLEAVYAIHVDPTLESGRYGLITGPITSAADRFDVVVTADGTGHSARPHETTDTVWSLTQIAQAFYQLTGRVTDARNASIITICKLEGSDAHNVIPDTAHLAGTLRCIDPSDRKQLKVHMKRIVEQTAARCGGRGTLTFDAGPPSVVNDGRLIQNVRRTIRQRFSEKAIYSIPRPSMGAEDFSHFLQHVPGALIRVGTSSSPETSFPLHNAHFDMDESTLAPTAHLMATVLRNHLHKRILG